MNLYWDHILTENGRGDNSINRARWEPDLSTKALSDKKKYTIQP